MADRGELDVVGIGNALVDVLSHAEDGFLARQGLAKGTMHLVDEPRARELYDAMGPGIEMSGGSAANTMVGVASFGGRAHYVGKVRDDQLGEVFGHDLRADRRGLRHAARHRRPAHRALPHPGHARRPAHHEHVPRRVGAARPRRHRRGAHHARQDPLPRGLPLRSARGPGGVPGGGGHRARGRPQGLAHAVGSLLRGAASQGLPRPGRASRGHPLRQRGGDLRALRGRRLRRRAGRGCAGTARSPRSPGARRAR